MPSIPIDSSAMPLRRGQSGTQTNPRGRALRLISLAQLAADQRRVVSRDQLHLLGWSHQQIEHEIVTGRWHAPAPTVVALQNAPLVHDQRLWLGTLHARPRGVISHATACSASGLQRWDAGLIDVLTPKGDLVDEIAGFRFHQTRRDYAAWVHPTRMPPTLTIEHAALLAAERDRSVRRAVGRLAAVVQQRLSTASRLETSSREISKLRHGKILRLALGDICGGAQSFAEIDLGRLCAMADLSPPDRQRMRRDKTGRRRYLDCEWELPDRRLVVLEIDGSFHLETEHWWVDMKRERAIVITGRIVLRCSSLEMRLDPWDIISDLVKIGVPHL